MNSFSVGGVLSKSFSIWLKNLIPFSILSLVMFSPLVIYTMVYLSGDNLTLEGLLRYGLITLALTLVLSNVATGAMTYGVFQQLRGQHASLVDCIVVGLKRALPVIAVGIIAGILIVLGMIALIVPGIILACMFYVAAPAAVVEKPGVFGALRRSADLTKGYKGSIFGVLFLLGVINWVVDKIMSTAMIDQASSMDDIKTYLMVNLAWSIVFGALQAVTNAVVYHDLRVVKEGVAVEELAKVFD